MTEKTQTPHGKNLFIGQFEKRWSESTEPEWLRSRRRDAMQHFAHLDFPTSRDEAWRETNIAPIRETSFVVAEPAHAEGLEAALRFEGMQAARLTFVNGHFDRSLSDLSGLPRGVTVASLAQRLEAAPQSLDTLLGRAADGQDNAFVCLNTGLFTDGAYIEIPAGTDVEQTIHVQFLQTNQDGPTVAQVRNLVVAGRGAKVKIFESYAGEPDAVYFTNAVTEFFVDDDADVRHVKLQQESTSAYHFETIQVRQGQNSYFSNHAISDGAALSRNDIGAYLDGENIESVLDGLYMVDGKRHADTHTRMDHAKPNCNSHERYKGILDDDSSSVFTGRIYVHPDAQKTDAIQNNAALLLTDRARADTQPQLEIFADDVKCTHGATIGQLDENAMFYLRTRGISEGRARGILTYAFANEVIEGIVVQPVREYLEHLVAERYRH